MSRYAADGTDAVTSSPGATALHVTRGASRRIHVYDFTMGASGTPADNALVWEVKRHTTAPTSSGVTPAPLDTADPASISTAGENATVEPTFGGILFRTALNQRATYRWVAAPGGELVVPDSANAGIAWVPVHATYNGNVEITAHFLE